jgi:hypothetical protein
VQSNFLWVLSPNLVPYLERNVKMAKFRAIQVSLIWHFEQSQHIKCKKFCWGNKNKNYAIFQPKNVSVPFCKFDYLRANHFSLLKWMRFETFSIVLSQNTSSQNLSTFKSVQKVLYKQKFHSPFEKVKSD